MTLFDELEDKIKEKILSHFNITEEVTLVKCFFNPKVRQEIDDKATIGGPTVPMIMVVGNQSGQIHFFALKALFPNS